MTDLSGSSWPMIIPSFGVDLLPCSARSLVSMLSARRPTALAPWRPLLNFGLM